MSFKLTLIREKTHGQQLALHTELFMQKLLSPLLLPYLTTSDWELHALLITSSFMCIQVSHPFETADNENTLFVYWGSHTWSIVAALSLYYFICQYWIMLPFPSAALVYHLCQSLTGLFVI